MEKEMDIERFKISDSKKFLLISAKPAPNGRLHLGHLSGPYLRQDAIRRHYLSRGASVFTICGTDPIDSFIRLKATQKNVSPEKLAAQCFEQICQDFKEYDIHFDAFIDPLSTEWRELYIKSFSGVISRCKAEHLIEEKIVSFPFSKNMRGAGGASISGFCPDCENSVCGYFCEDCGAHFEPHEIVKPMFKNLDAASSFEEVSDLFYKIQRPDELLQSLKNMGVGKDYLDIVERQFKKERVNIRLTERSEWGVSLDSSEDRQYFGHGLLFAYCRLIGEIFKSLANDDINPFDAESKVTTVNLFGIDNTVSHMVNIQAIGHEVKGWKGFDRFVVNHFYLLEGKKFSTSSAHVVVANDIIKIARADSDAVRFVISATSPTKAQTDLKLDEFLYHYNQVYISKIHNQLILDTSKLDGEMFHGVSRFVEAKFRSLWVSVCNNYESSSFALEDQVEYILSWEMERESMVNKGSLVDLYGWIVCMCLLLYPISPKLCDWIWGSLGLPDSPNLCGYSMPSTVNVMDKQPYLQPILMDNVLSAMPHGARQFALNKSNSRQHL